MSPANEAVSPPVRRAAAAWGSVSAVVATALVPKCPLCVAAALSALGVGAASARLLGPYVRALLPVLATALVVTIVVALSRRRTIRCRCAIRARAPRSTKVGPSAASRETA
jgi:hypothetical protein